VREVHVAQLAQGGEEVVHFLLGVAQDEGEGAEVVLADVVALEVDLEMSKKTQTRAAETKKRKRGKENERPGRRSG